MPPTTCHTKHGRCACCAGCALEGTRSVNRKGNVLPRRLFDGTFLRQAAVFTRPPGQEVGPPRLFEKASKLCVSRRKKRSSASKSNTTFPGTRPLAWPGSKSRSIASSTGRRGWWSSNVNSKTCAGGGCTGRTGAGKRRSSVSSTPMREWRAEFPRGAGAAPKAAQEDRRTAWMGLKRRSSAASMPRGASAPRNQRRSIGGGHSSSEEETSP